MVKFGVPTDEQLAKINKLAPKTFSAEEVFCFSGKSAGDMIIDNRFIQLSKELLETFIRDAKTGVSWLLNHSWASWSESVTIFGRTFDGRLESSNEKGETVAMYLDKYVPRSDTLKNGRSANSVIEDIENGVLFDTSIGWGSNKMVCSICNMDYYGGECVHLRGKTYEDADGNRKLCYIIAKNPGFLMEESGVFDGAYKGAGISMSAAGDEFETPQGKFMVVEELKELPKDTNVFGISTSKGELVTFIKKSDHKKIHSLSNTGNADEKGVVKMSLSEKSSKMLEFFGVTFKEGEIKLEELLNQIGEKWDATVQKIKDSVEPIKPAEAFMTSKQAIEKLGKETSADDVLKLAKEGQSYRDELVKEALKMGVRAQGDAFKQETWERNFSLMEVQDIKNTVDTWEIQAKVAIPAGRVSDPAAGLENQAKANLPDEAYKMKK